MILSGWQVCKERADLSGHLGSSFDSIAERIAY